MPTVDIMTVYKEYVHRAREIARQTADPEATEHYLQYAGKAQLYGKVPAFFYEDKGFAILVIAKNRGWLIIIATRKQDEGKGIGTKIMTAILYSTRHLDAVGLRVRKDNRRAFEWYLRKGFKITGMTETEYRMLRK